MDWKDIKQAIKNHVGYGITDEEVEKAYCRFFYTGGVDLKDISFIEIAVKKER